MHGQGNDESTEESGKSRDGIEQLVASALGDFIAIGGDLGRNGTAVLQVKVPDLFSQDAGKESSAEGLGHADCGYCHQDVGTVSDDETADEKVDEVQNQGIHLALESIGRNGAGGEVAELGGKRAKDDSHQGHGSARNDSAKKGDGIHCPGP